MGPMKKQAMKRGGQPMALKRGGKAKKQGIALYCHHDAPGQGKPAKNCKTSGTTQE